MGANTSVRRALITGITGQTGSYLADLLLNQGCQVHGLVRRASSFNRSRIEHLRSNPSIAGNSLHLHYADLSDPTTIRRLINTIRPSELYHLAGQSHVGLSFDIPESTCQEVAMATLAILEICRDLEAPPRIFHASSSEVFGRPCHFPQNEETAFRPSSPYGCAKSFATQISQVYRQSYGLFICNGILYNHESPRRSENFVTRKIAKAAAAAAAGKPEILELGNLDAERDWGYALEYADVIIRMLQHPAPGDYIVATGKATSVRDFALAAYRSLGSDLVFQGRDTEEVGIDPRNGQIRIRINPKFYRPSESASLVGDASRARHQLDWRPAVKGLELAALMANAELADSSAP
ncbi:MAG: GDP-mannose 4,6-dehydratase [Cyanobacteriota bacterium]|nr:GDP-mannose 4,6-dehydratase [Cyanobacteriota bacterium]